MKKQRINEVLCTYEESLIKNKLEKQFNNKRVNHTSFQDLRSSCNEDMVKYKDPRPSTSQTRALNERSNKVISPATTQPPGWRVCRSTGGRAARLLEPTKQDGNNKEDNELVLGVKLLEKFHNLRYVEDQECGNEGGNAAS
ncbi:hypothetical protein Tco_1207739 [Tanacetum coccineum]